MDQTLLMKYFRGETSPEEEHRILSWVEASPENRAEFRKAHLLFDGLVLYGPKPEDMQSNADKKHWEGWRFARHTVRIAAAIVGIVGAAYFGKVYYHRLLSKQQTLISVPAGQRMQMTLADGTLVHLNAGTTLEYPVVFSRKDRRVKLTGEALFEVAHNAKHPFIVETFATDLQVLGTKFNVLADPNNEVFSTTLIEGKVKVTNRNDPAESIIMQPNDMVVLENGRLYKERVSDFADLCWTEGLIHLKKMPFDELMTIFERAFDVRIRIERTTMPQIHVMSGEIRISDGVDYALHVLQLVSSEFTYTRDEKTNVIVIK
ncbi:FecR family protein [uncultured Alistipes sp.]|nr:FecR family protein [uncultured Alistipes sp.]